MNTEIIDDLLEKEVYIIDFLPETVPKNCGGSYFDVEYYILNSKNSKIIKDRFLFVILKIMCYYHVSVFWNGFVENPTPELIESAMSEIMENHSGTLNIFISHNEYALLVFDWDCSYLALYNPSDKMKDLFEKISVSEGLFFRKAED